MASIASLRADQAKVAGLIATELLIARFDEPWRRDEESGDWEPSVARPYAQTPEKKHDPEIERLASQLGYTYATMLTLVLSMGIVRVNVLAGQAIGGTEAEQAMALAELNKSAASPKAKLYEDTEYDWTPAPQEIVGTGPVKRKKSDKDADEAEEKEEKASPFMQRLGYGMMQAAEIGWYGLAMLPLGATGEGALYNLGHLRPGPDLGKLRRLGSMQSDHQFFLPHHPAPVSPRLDPEELVLNS